MNNIHSLINSLCSDGVQFVQLREVMKTLKKGTLTTYQLIQDGKYPVINSGRELYGRYNSYNNTFPAITIAARGEYAGWISFFNEKFWAGGLCYPYASKNEEILCTKFCYYYLKCKEQHIMDTLVTRGSIPALNKIDVDNFPIPLPPLEVQHEIVRILDKFSNYAAELQAELQARKLQYEFYRNALLSFDSNNPLHSLINSLCPDGVQFKSMAEIFEMRNGYTPSKSNPAFWEGGTIPWFRMEDIRESGRILSDAMQHITPEAVKGKGLFEKGSFILATTATIGEHALLIADSLANQQFTNLKIRKSLAPYLLTKFVYYYLFIVDDFCKNNTNVSGFASVDMGKLKKMPFPIPPLEVQHEIVRILDKFSSLVNDLADGLPAEIDAVRLQYEYYRNSLLSFKQIH